MKIKTKNMYRGVCGFKTTLPANYTQSKNDNQTYTKTQCLCGLKGVFAIKKIAQTVRLTLGGVD